MKHTIHLLLLVFVMTSCQDTTNNTSIEIAATDSNIIDSSINEVETLDNQNLETNKIDSILPTPDNKFMSQFDSSSINDAGYVIGKYIETYFLATKKREVIEKANKNHPEIPGQDCKFRTEYKYFNVTEDYGCDSYDQTTTIEFTHYTLLEVKRVIKILLPKVAEFETPESNEQGWDKDYNHYGYGDFCGLDIFKMENRIFVEFGCGN